MSFRWFWLRFQVYSHRFMSKEELQALPQQAWMEKSKKPKMHQWLCKNQRDGDQMRLKAIGNVVVPFMAHFAMQILCGR